VLIGFVSSLLLLVGIFITVWLIIEEHKARVTIPPPATQEMQQPSHQPSGIQRSVPVVHKVKRT
jgi:hypothetical protein